MKTSASPISVDTTIEFITEAIPKLEELNLDFINSYNDDSKSMVELHIYDNITRQLLTFYIPYIRINEWNNAFTQRAKAYHIDLIVQDVLFDNDSIVADIFEDEFRFISEENFNEYTEWFDEVVWPSDYTSFI